VNLNLAVVDSRQKFGRFRSSSLVRSTIRTRFCLLSRSAECRGELEC
jgi:hypothetical protein